MNSILITVVDRTASGSYHVKLYIDEKESGIFYLSPDQLNIFAKIFKTGAYNEDVSFILENPYEDSEEDLDDEYSDEETD